MSKTNKSVTYEMIYQRTENRTTILACEETTGSLYNIMSELPRAATKSTKWDSTTADTHNEKLSLNYCSVNKQPRSLNFPTPLAKAYTKIEKLYNL